MAYKQQLAEWLQEHPKATKEEAIEAGYIICTQNWCLMKK